MQNDHAYSEPWLSQNRLIKQFQEYLAIFRDTDVYSATLTGAELREEGRPPQLFLEIEKSVLIFERKALIVSIFGLNFPFKM